MSVMDKKLGLGLWCAAFHRRYWSMIAAEGENAWLHCARCGSQWWSSRMDVVISRIPDARIKSEVAQ